MYDQVLELLSHPWGRFVVSLGLGVIVGMVVAGVLRVIAGRSTRPVVRSSANQLPAVAFLLCVLSGLRRSLDGFSISLVSLAQIESAYTMLVYLLITWGANKIYESIHVQVLQPWGQRRDNVTLVNVGSTVMHVILWTVGIVSGLSSAGYNVATVLAGLGFGGLAFALAAQDTIANIFGGVVVLTQSPFQVGNQIEVGGVRGWVKSIGLRYTTITTWMGHKITFPNKKFTDNAVTNIDARTEYWQEMRVKLRYDCSLAQIERAQENIRSMLEGHDSLTPAIWVGLCNIGEGFVEIEVWYAIKKYQGESDRFPNEYGKILGVKDELNRALLKALEDEQIPLAVPVQGRFTYDLANSQVKRF